MIVLRDTSESTSQVKDYPGKTLYESQDQLDQGFGPRRRTANTRPRSRTTGSA